MFITRARPRRARQWLGGRRPFAPRRHSGRRVRELAARANVSTGRTAPAQRAGVDRLKAAAPAISGAVCGALAAYLLDPRSGRRRRHTARDRVVSKMRRTERAAAVRARRAEWRAVGTVRRTLNARRPMEQPDDATLAHKVESTLFRHPGMPKGRININAEDGVVFLRGTVDGEETIREVERVARQVRGVRDVENLLHLPATPAPASRPKLARDRATG